MSNSIEGGLLLNQESTLLTHLALALWDMTSFLTHLGMGLRETLRRRARARNAWEPRHGAKEDAAETEPRSPMNLPGVNPERMESCWDRPEWRVSWGFWV